MKIIILILSCYLSALNAKCQILPDSILANYYNEALNYYSKQGYFKVEKKEKSILLESTIQSKQLISEFNGKNIIYTKNREETLKYITPLKKNKHRHIYQISHEKETNNPDTINIYIKEMEFLDRNKKKRISLFSSSTDKGIPLKVYFDAKDKVWTFINYSQILDLKVK